MDAISVRSVNTLVVGSGAAGLKAAVSLHALGQRDVLLVTEAWGGGTSANAGSDKQTYYKLALAGRIADSPRLMAEDLAAGGCMHGDIALAEAQHSAQAFYHLVALGVPFPHDAFGGYPGYRTDHDARGRGTSAGPLTSRHMVDALGREARERGIAVLDRHQAVALLCEGDAGHRRVAGALALDVRDPGSGEARFVLVNARSVVLATGGPGAMYADSVYPPDQAGAIGLALAVGATAQNLTESQFGLASIGVRWNVSGSYQQVIPRYVSTDRAGNDERDFLDEGFPTVGALASAIFRKGYQWPFDPRKVGGGGSSLIDLLVYRERVQRGRRVFLDYTRNPGAGDGLPAFSLDLLDEEAQTYLQASGARGDTPIDRLRQLNPPAIDFYRGRGIDLGRDRLEIAVCAQHNNGGLKGGLWWETDVEGLFAVGEVNGSHGVYRPGGAALNAGQVGALRAAMFIARRRAAPPPPQDAFLSATRDQAEEMLRFARHALSGEGDQAASIDEVRCEIQQRMSRAGSMIRSASAATDACREAWALCDRLSVPPLARDVSELREAFRNRELALAHAVYLEAIAEYTARGGRSRGSYAVLELEREAGAGGAPAGLPFTLNPPGAFVDAHVLEIGLTPDGRVRKVWTPVRPIPDPDSWFENVWRGYREDRVIR